jgi:hypothetical protein
MSFLSDALEIIGSPAAAQVLSANERFAQHLKSASTMARYGATIQVFRNIDNQLTQALGTIADKTEKLAGALDRIQNLVRDLRAINTMGKALNFVTVHNIQSDPQSAALAFGTLFSNAGRIARLLPFPLSHYGEFLAGFDTFFLDIYEKIAPMGKERSMGRSLQDLDWSLTGKKGWSKNPYPQF